MTLRHLVTLAALALGAGGACAQQMGKNASKGFVQGLQDHRTEDKEQQVVRVATERAVAGAFDALDDPEQKEVLRALVSTVAAQAAASAVAAMNDPQQRQQLAAIMSTVVEESVTSAFESSLSASGGANGPAARLAGDIARAATRDAMAEVSASLGANLEQLFPGCKGTDIAACRRQHLRSLTREAGAGFTAGVLDSIKWFGLLAAGFVGLLVGLLLHWLWTSRPTHPAGPLVSINGGRHLREAHGTRGP